MNPQDVRTVWILICVVSLLTILAYKMWPGQKRTPPIWKLLVKVLYLLGAHMFAFATGVHEFCLVYEASYQKFKAAAKETIDRPLGENQIDVSQTLFSDSQEFTRT